MVHVDQEKFVPEFVIRKRGKVVINNSDASKVLEDTKK